MFKNVSGQKIYLYAYNATGNGPVSGDAANITAYLARDYGSVTALSATGITELDATNAKGYYSGVVSQSESNADVILVSAKSTTANVVVLGAPALVTTLPPNFGVTSIDASGNVAGNLLYSAGVPIRNYDGTVQQQVGNVIRLPSTDSLGNAIPASGQFAWHEINVVSGTGRNTRPLLRDWVSGYDYNADPASVPIPLDSTSQFIVGPTTYQANVTSLSGNATGASNMRDYMTGVHFQPVDALKQNFNATGTTLYSYEPDGTTVAYTKTITTTVSTSGITATVKN